VHTPLSQSGNETIARVLLQRWQRGPMRSAMAVSADLGFYVLIHGGAPMAAESWRDHLDAARFGDDFQEHLHTSDLLAKHFASVAQTGLMLLRNPAGRKRKVGGKDWTERRPVRANPRQRCRFRAAAPGPREAISSTLRSRRCSGVCRIPGSAADSRATSGAAITVR